MEREARLPFAKFARIAASVTGRPTTFIIAALIIIAWAISGPLFGFGDTWQLVINTSATIITFLMVFLLQNTQDRHTEALQIKLDELIRATKGARNEVLNLEELDKREVNRIRQEYLDLADHAQLHIQRRTRPRGVGISK